VSGVIVDSNVLIDIASDSAAWYDWSADRIDELSSSTRLIINPIVYAEISITFASIDDVESFLSHSPFEREDLPFEAAFLAGKAFAAYRRRGGDRTSLLPDFLIGAHAAVRGYRILTRDDHRYRGYFPSVKLITPRKAN